MEIIKNIRGPKGKFNRDVRKKLNKIEKCDVCKSQCYNYQLEVDHTIPLAIGGELEDYKLLCKRCHLAKTSIDVGIIAFFKRLKLVIKTGYEEYEIHNKERLIRLYSEIYQITKDRESEIKQELGEPLIEMEGLKELLD